MPHPVHLDYTGPGQSALAPDEVDVFAGEPPHLALVGVIGDHQIAPRQHCLNIDLRLARGLAGTRHRLARTEQCLRGNAAPIRAQASDEFSLHDRHTQAALRERICTMLARGAGAQDNDVIFGVHFLLP